MPGCPSNAAYREPLPISCPPDVAGPTNGKCAWRAVASNPPTVLDFASIAALDPKRQAKTPPHKLCELRSVSLFVNKEAAAALRKLPKKGHLRFVALVELVAGSGCMQTNSRSGHVHWWPFASATPENQVRQIEGV